MKNGNKFHSDLSNKSQYKIGSGNMQATFARQIEDGKYNGKIIRVEERTEPYEYTDFVCEFIIEKKPIELTFGCPSNLIYDEKTKKPVSKLAMLLDEYGFKMEFNREITIVELEKHFVGKSVTSLIANEKSKKGGVYATMKTMTPKL
jgi:hypothetical protein